MVRGRGRGNGLVRGRGRARGRGGTPEEDKVNKFVKEGEALIKDFDTLSQKSILSDFSSKERKKLKSKIC